MTLVSGQVRVAGTGELFLAPVGTTLPTAASGTLDPAFNGYGYTTDDGVTLGKSISRDGVAAWQSATPVRNIITAQELTVALTLLQSNADNLKLWLQSGDFASDGGTGFRADVPVDPVGLQFAMVLEWKDVAITSRLLAAKVEVTETGDVTVARQAQAFPVTLSALPPDSGSVLASWLTSDAAFAAA
ncbi:phage tail tube protein [Kribbella sp. WER1]